jgi:hypothetical protein
VLQVPVNLVEGGMALPLSGDSEGEWISVVSHCTCTVSPPLPHLFVPHCLCRVALEGKVYVMLRSDRTILPATLHCIRSFTLEKGRTPMEIASSDYGLDVMTNRPLHAIPPAGYALVVIRVLIIR